MKLDVKDAAGKQRFITIRQLVRGEIKGLKEYGYTYFGCVPAMDNANDAQDKCLETVLTDQDMAFLDNCTNQEATKVWTQILKETYGARDEEKNSSATSRGTQTDKE